MSHNNCKTKDGYYAPSRCTECIRLVQVLKDEIHGSVDHKRAYKTLGALQASSYARRTRNSHWEETAKDFFNSDEDRDLVKEINYTPKPRSDKSFNSQRNESTSGQNRTTREDKGTHTIFGLNKFNRDSALYYSSILMSH